VGAWEAVGCGLSGDKILLRPGKMPAVELCDSGMHAQDMIVRYEFVCIDYLS
jgi:hypothetical protein